jgi:hypothetical protein
LASCSPICTPTGCRPWRRPTFRSTSTSGSYSRTPPTAPGSSRPATSRRFGITFTASAAAQAHARASGGDLGAVLGTGQWELPMPTVVVIDRSRVVRFADVHPDWLVRTEAGAVLDAVRRLAAVPA